MLVQFRAKQKALCRLSYIDPGQCNVTGAVLSKLKLPTLEGQQFPSVVARVSNSPALAKRSVAALEIDRQQRPSPATARALAGAVGGVGALEAMSLPVLLKAGGQVPGRGGAAVAPAGARGPYRLGALAERECRLRAVPVVAPDRRLAGRSWRGRQQRHAGEENSEQRRQEFHDWPFRAQQHSAAAPARQMRAVHSLSGRELPSAGAHCYGHKSAGRAWLWSNE